MVAWRGEKEGLQSQERCPSNTSFFHEVEELIFLGNDFLRKIVALALSWSGEPGKRGKGREENGQLSDNIIKKHTTTITIILLK